MKRRRYCRKLKRVVSAVLNGLVLVCLFGLGRLGLVNCDGEAPPREARTITAMPNAVNFKTLRSLPVLLGLVIALPGCVPPYGPKEVVRDTSYFAAPYTITEEVQYDYSSLGDDYFRRVYVVQTDGQDAIQFEGDTTMWGINVDLSKGAPKRVDDWLSVFSLDRVWIWQPGHTVRSFSPYDPSDSLDIDVWTANGEERPLNWGHWASDFQISGDKWILQYTDAYSREDLSDPITKHFYFVSEDQGETFVPVVNPADLPSGLFESL